MENTQNQTKKEQEKEIGMLQKIWKPTTAKNKTLVTTIPQEIREEKQLKAGQYIEILYGNVYEAYIEKKEENKKNKGETKK